MNLPVLTSYMPMASTQVREGSSATAGSMRRRSTAGWRMLAYKDEGRVRLVSRNGRDHTRRFAGVAAAVAALPARSLVLDGEVAAVLA